MHKTEYGSVVSAYESYTTSSGLAERRLGHVSLIEELGRIDELMILDFGCGPATFGAMLSNAGAHVVGLDIDRGVIFRARQLDPRGDYRVYRGLLDKELAGMKFEVIIATFSFCVVPDQELRYILQDMRQILEPGGRLLILEPNLEKALGVQYANLHYHRKENVQSGDYVHVTLGSGDETVELYDDIYRAHSDYQALLEEAGFTVERLTEPKPDPSWGSGWEAEMEYPPFLIITAR